VVDAAVLIVKAGSTPFELVERAIQAIGRERTVGVVLNRADPAEGAAGYAYYDSHYRATNAQGSA